MTRMKTISKTIKSREAGGVNPDGGGDIDGSQDDNAGGRDSIHKYTL